MKAVAVTLRRDSVLSRREDRDGLDARWWEFCKAVGVVPLCLPNDLELARALLDRVAVQGVLLTGGGDLAAQGGAQGDRDQVENWLIERALSGGLPVLGVCRGMQAIQGFFGTRLERVENQVLPTQTIEIEGRPQVVNSYHDWGTLTVEPPLHAWAHSQEGIIKAVRHETAPLVGMMWHPERLDPFRPQDLELFRRVWEIAE